MAIATHRDLEHTREQLQAWLTGRLRDAVDITVGDVSIPPGAGFSNETLFADATWTEAGRLIRRALVIRVEPSTHTLYLQAPQRFHRQVALLHILGEATELPVARIRFVEDDPAVLGSPFFVMDRIQGDTVPDLPPYNQQGWLRDATPEQQRDLWWSTVDQLIAVHRTDWRTLRLDAHLDTAGTGTQLDYFDQFYDWAREGHTYPVLEHAGTWLRDNLPADEPQALCWGDARLANVIYQSFQPAAIIDWDLVALGNPSRTSAGGSSSTRSNSPTATPATPLTPTGCPDSPPPPTRSRVGPTPPATQPTTSTTTPRSPPTNTPSAQSVTSAS